MFTNNNGHGDPSAIAIAMLALAATIAILVAIVVRLSRSGNKGPTISAPLPPQTIQITTPRDYRRDPGWGSRYPLDTRWHRDDGHYRARGAPPWTRRSGEHKEHFGGGLHDDGDLRLGGGLQAGGDIQADDNNTYSELFGYSHRDSQQITQRISLRGDGPDDEDDDSSREFYGHMYSAAVVDPTIEREADELARSMRYQMMGGDLPPCNCDPESCQCAWGLQRARDEVWRRRYPDGPCRPLTPEVGVEIGPMSGSECGIPDRYAIPAEPICWGEPNEGDYYGPEGPTVNVDDMYSLTEPDHLLLH